MVAECCFASSLLHIYWTSISRLLHQQVTMKLSFASSLALALMACLATTTTAQVNCTSLDFAGCLNNWMTCTPYAEFPWTVTYGIPACRDIQCYDRPQYECTPGMGCTWDATNLACKDQGSVTPCWDRKTVHGCAKTDGLCAFDFDRNVCVAKPDYIAQCMYSQTKAQCDDFSFCLWFNATDGTNTSRCIDQSTSNFDYACDMLNTTECASPCYLIDDGVTSYCHYSPPMSEWMDPPTIATTNFPATTTTMWYTGCIICTTAAPTINDASSISSVVAGVIGVAVFVGFMALVLGVYKGAKALSGTTKAKAVVTPIQVKPAGSDAFAPSFEV
eukprot:m.227572 g.227572  ORF g.227572 m.227572 type:complete len:331 (+) comp15181_c1_seq1:441-1433(+)